MASGAAGGEGGSASSAISGPPSAGGASGVNAGGAEADMTASCRHTVERTLDLGGPNVLFLVSRSGSMFTPYPDGMLTSWNLLRSGVLEVLNDLPTEMRVGFAAFSGHVGACPDLLQVMAARANRAAISAFYSTLEMSQLKEDSPLSLALSRAASLLWSDPTPGEKTIVLVTDGNTDYCDDGNPLCPPDSVVGRLQNLAAGREVTELGTVIARPPIRTLVFGTAAPTIAAAAARLQTFANAGAGEPVALAVDPIQATQLFALCSSSAGWLADFETTGKPSALEATIGSYSAVAGSAPVYGPTAADEAALVAAVQSAMPSAVPSCTFDLAPDGIAVDAALLDLGERAVVRINGAAVPLGDTNGWRLLSPTSLQLEGSACEAWRAAGENRIEFSFPC
jgi:hypothetical protein